MSTPYKLLFSLGLILGTLMAISSSSWFTIWMGMEINTMMFIPLVSSAHKLAAEAALKYFIIQAVSSVIMLTAAIATTANFSLNLEILSISYSPWLLAIQLSLIMKLGAAPLHFWFPQVMEGMTWPTILLLLTWQKIAPAMVLLLIGPSPTTAMSGLTSAILGTLGGLNHTSMRKILAFSSISHLGWTLMSMNSSDYLFIFYLISYCMLSATIIMVTLMLSISSIMQVFTNKSNSLFLMLPLLSLGGLPPFLGFLPKWMVLTSLISVKAFIPSLILILCSVITLIYYIRISLAATLLMKTSHSWINHQMKISQWTTFLASSSLLSFPIITLMQ